MERFIVSKISSLFLSYTIFSCVTQSNQITAYSYYYPKQLWQEIKRVRSETPYFYKHFYINPYERHLFKPPQRQGEHLDLTTTIVPEEQSEIQIIEPITDSSVGPQVTPVPDNVQDDNTETNIKKPEKDKAKEISPTIYPAEHPLSHGQDNNQESEEESIEITHEFKYKEGVGYPKPYPSDIANSTNDDDDVIKFNDCADLLFLCKNTERNIPVCAMNRKGEKTTFNNFCQISYLNCMHKKDQWVYLRDYNCSKITSNTDYDLSNVNIPMAVNPVAAAIPHVDWDVQYDDPFVQEKDSSQEKFFDKVQDEMDSITEASDGEKSHNDIVNSESLNETENRSEIVQEQDIKAKMDSIIEEFDGKKPHEEVHNEPLDAPKIQSEIV